MIEDGSTVSIEYTLKLDDGTTADSNVGDEPLVYQQGQQQILPALEQALSGLDPGESTEVTLAPEQAYGPVNPELRRDVEPDLVPEDARKAGTQLVSEDPEGNRRLLRVHEVHEDRITLDFNHPLAGETLHFAVKVVDVS